MNRVIDWNSEQIINDTLYFPIELELPKGVTTADGNPLLKNKTWLQVTRNKEKYKFQMMTLFQEESEIRSSYNGNIVFEDYFKGNPEIIRVRDGVLLSKAKAKDYLRANKNPNKAAAKYNCEVVAIGTTCVGHPTEPDAPDMCETKYETICKWVNNPSYPTLPTIPEPGHGEGGSNSQGSETVIVLDPEVSIENLQKRLECFNNVPDNANTKYRITIHSELANPKSPIDVIEGNSVGHAFITLEKVNGTNISRLFFGFYPKNSFKATIEYDETSAIGDDGENLFRRSDIQYTKSISNSSFKNVLSTSVRLAKDNYNLEHNNCTHYALNVFNSGMDSNSLLTLTASRNFLAPYDNPSQVYRTLELMSANGNTNVKIGIGLVPKNRCN
ncbi:hypothetical protein [Sphingobacterium daejeonense]|uniref:hypothetical protein n=1 Tax=Sphingobacterium daejeonense TaxID=371142 RepID=UPI0010C408F8|nr:hypothetical protein [Sphingobacterium daejeonense]VTP96428.1 Uncharacterised protein [Sphingobacterium daejeonense]